MTKEKEEIFEIINILDKIRLQQEFYKKLWPKAEWINAEKFQKVFGFYATEMWAKSEKEFLEWINSEAPQAELKTGELYFIPGRRSGLLSLLRSRYERKHGMTKRFYVLCNRGAKIKGEKMTKQKILDYLDNVLHPIVSPDNWNVYSELYDMIEELPSEEPARHGKWEMKPDPFGFFDNIPVCSECGRTTKMREKTKYCPNCGAKMDRRGENEYD